MCLPAVPALVTGSTYLFLGEVTTDDVASFQRFCQRQACLKHQKLCSLCLNSFFLLATFHFIWFDLTLAIPVEYMPAFLMNDLRAIYLDSECLSVVRPLSFCIFVVQPVL